MAPDIIERWQASA